MQDIDWQPPAHDHVRARSSNASNTRIDRETRGALDEVERSPTAIRARLDELDREWNVDRALMLNFAIAGTISGALSMRNLLRDGSFGVWGALFFTQMTFLAHHALRGWCPPLPVLRRLGFRTAREICAERAALEKRLLQLESDVPF